MDTIDWSQERYELISKKIGQFLSRQAGFKDADVSFVPVSGLSGENLINPAKESKLTDWFSPGHTLIELIGKSQIKVLYTRFFRSHLILMFE